VREQQAVRPHFSERDGETPAPAIERLRAEVARARVEDSHEPIETIARQVGSGDVQRMRRSFVRLHGQSLQTLRRISRSQSSAQ